MSISFQSWQMGLEIACPAMYNTEHKGKLYYFPNTEILKT